MAPKRKNAQLNLVYTEKPELVLEDTLMTELTKEVTRLSLAPLSRQIHFLPFGGRISWSALLPQVFGQDFHDLDHTYSKAMYTAIERAFRAIEEAKDSSSINPKQGPHALLAPHPPKASASRLISTLTTYLPSMQHGQGRMERQFKLTPQEAAKVHLEQMHFLASVCKCPFCSKTPGTASVPRRPQRQQMAVATTTVQA